MQEHIKQHRVGDHTAMCNRRTTIGKAHSDMSQIGMRDIVWCTRVSLRDMDHDSNKQTYSVSSKGHSWVCECVSYGVQSLHRENGALI